MFRHPHHLQPPPRLARARRLVLPAALLASLLWHLLVLGWAGGRLAFPSLSAAPAPVVTVNLQPAVAAAEAPPPPRPKPRQRPKPRRAAPPPATPAPVAAPEALPPATVAAADADTASVPGIVSAEAGPEAPALPEGPAELQAAPEAPAAALPRIALPPSAELKYEVQALRDGKQWFGSGLFVWQTSGDAYAISGEASISALFFDITVLNFRSEGALGEGGIAPVLYSEKPWRKAATNTHFQHEKQTISFSASQLVYPYTGTEQDRASIMWQLAGIGRGDASQFAPGTALNIMVAGARNADTWTIEVIGEEEIDTPFGRMSAWHVVRAPKPGSYDQKIDIWLSPQHEWYPAKVRFTYANGDYLDMALSSLRAQAASATGEPLPGEQ